LPKRAVWAARMHCCWGWCYRSACLAGPGSARVRAAR
jgi:hypothetical protein